MKRLISLAVLIIPLSACVTIESPDNLISDTIKAGKDVYKDIKGDKDDETTIEERIDNSEADLELGQQAKTITIEHFEAILDGMSELETMAKCMKNVEKSAMATLGKRELNAKDKTYINTEIDGKATIICGATFVI